MLPGVPWVIGLKVKKLASQWKPLARFVMMVSRMFNHLLWICLTITGLVTVVVIVVEFTTVVVVTIVVVVVPGGAVTVVVVVEVMVVVVV